MKQNNAKVLAMALSVAMIFSPNKIDNKEYKYLPTEPTKIEAPVMRRLKPNKKKN